SSWGSSSGRAPGGVGAAGRGPGSSAPREGGGPETRKGAHPSSMPRRTRHSRASRSRSTRAASRRRYSSSSMAPISSSIWSASISSLIRSSSVSSLCATPSTCRRENSTSAFGPVTGQNRRCFRMPRASPPRSARALELELDVHEVVGRPGPRVLEGQQALVALAQPAHRLVELVLARPLDEEGGVQDHAVADELVRLAGHGERLELGVEVRNELVRALLERRLDEAAELDPREVGR